MGVDDENKKLKSQKTGSQYSSDSEKRDKPDDNADTNSMIKGSKKQEKELKKNGGMDIIKKACSMNINDTIFPTITHYINMARDGHLLNLDSYNNYLLNKYRKKYVNYINKDNNRVNKLLENERNYFNNKYDKYDNSLYNELLNHRRLYFYDLQENKLDNLDEIIESLKKNIQTNKFYSKNEMIIRNEKQSLEHEKQKLNNSVDDLLNNHLNKNIEINTFKNKNLLFLKNISFYIYFIYIIYLFVFISILLITNFYNTITDFKMLFILLILILLPDYIYPYIYFNIIYPSYDVIYNNNMITKPNSPDAFEDISKNKFN